MAFGHEHPGARRRASAHRPAATVRRRRHARSSQGVGPGRVRRARRCRRHRDGRHRGTEQRAAGTRSRLDDRAAVRRCRHRRAAQQEAGGTTPTADPGRCRRALGRPARHTVGDPVGRTVRPPDRARPHPRPPPTAHQQHHVPRPVPRRRVVPRPSPGAGAPLAVPPAPRWLPAVPRFAARRRRAGRLAAALPTRSALGGARRGPPAAADPGAVGRSDRLRRMAHHSGDAATPTRPSARGAGPPR